MKVVYISGSPRKESNTDYLLKITLSLTGGKFVKLTDYTINACNSCRECLKSFKCVIKDDFSKKFIPMLLESNGIVLGSPVYFNNISAQLKALIDRTWSIRGKLKNKIGGAIVVGRQYGLESAITAINSFFLKHEMIPANRGVCGFAFNEGEIKNNVESIESAKKLGKRLLELWEIFKPENNTPLS